MTNKKKVFAAVVPLALALTAVGSIAAFAVSADGRGEKPSVESEISGNVSSVNVSERDGLTIFKMDANPADDVLDFLSIDDDTSLEFVFISGDTNSVIVNWEEEQCSQDCIVNLEEQCVQIDMSNISAMPLPLIAVKHSDESRFTPEQWAEILEQIERGEIFWED